jgi:RecA-family ATPase
MSAVQPIPGERLEVVQPRTRRRFLQRASALAGLPVPARVWQVPDLMPAGAVTILAGDGGVGKSRLALQLGAATALERPWLGHTPRRGPAIYLSSEDDGAELHRRAYEAALFYDVGLDDLDDLHLWPLAEEDPALAVLGRNQALERTDLWAELEVVADEMRPALVVLDSLADVFAGEENSRAQARQFIAQLRSLAIRTQAAVLVLAHPSLSGLNSGSGASGSTAWSNSVRSRLYLTQPSGDGLETDPDVRVLSLKKANYARAMPDIRLRSRIGGYTLEDHEPALDLTGAQAKADRQFLDLLDAYTAQGRIVTGRAGPNYAPSIFARDPASKGISSRGLAAAMNRLFAAGEIVEEEAGPPSRRRFRLMHVLPEAGA